MSGDVAMQDATPEGEQQRVVDIVNNDTDVKESRPPNTLILKASDLTRDEKMRLADLFELFMTAHKPLRKQSGETPSYQDFLGEIFASWSSDHKENNPPEIASPRLEDTSVQAGVLRCDSPSGRYLGKGCLPGGPRLAGAPVFLDFVLIPYSDVLMNGLWGFLFRDGNGEPCSEYSVKLTDEFDDAVDLQVSVMQKYDQDKRERVTMYNRELVVNAARRRICKWAIDGTETTARVDEDDRVSKDEIDDKPILAFGCVREWFEDAEELYTRFKAASS
ncbi:hypothetical protein NW767_005861 [Fusarium falciforme]|nr:hypothetical protein NW767_005861 [Fusarium falciforme]